jgi:hypothetical protein
LGYKWSLPVAVWHIFCLYKKQDCLKKVNLSTEISYNDIPKLTENQKQSLEGEISLLELMSALKRMKNNKSQDQMALQLTSLTFIWIDVGKFVFRSVNYGYHVIVFCKM